MTRMKWFLAAGMVFLFTATLLPGPTVAAPGNTRALWLACDPDVMADNAGNPNFLGKMESTYLAQWEVAPNQPNGNPPPPGWTAWYGGCWAHVGFQQFFVGIDKVYRMDSLKMVIAVVENLMSPPIEQGGATPPGFSAFLEHSMDGRTWTKVASANSLGGDGFRLTAGSSINPAAGGDTNSYMLLTYTPPAGTGPEFRFLRIRAPESALGGLSGYINYAYTCAAVPCTGTSDRYTLKVTEVRDAPALGTSWTDTTQTFSCAADQMEDPIAAHPCYYGGTNDYDSTSSFHTYFLGDARLDKISGTASLKPFRTVINDAEPGPTKYYVETSVDGTSWTLVASEEAAYDAVVPFAFDFPADDSPARFVRFAAEKHPLFENYYTLQRCDAVRCFIQGTDGWARRTESYFRSTELTIEGATLLAPGPIPPASLLPGLPLP